MASDAQACDGCGRCKEACLLLQKRDAVMPDLSNPGIARECMLCGACDAACPKGIRGTEIVLGGRRARFRLPLRQLPAWLEKAHYPFARYPLTPAHTIIFAGCYFPAFFPRATSVLQSFASRHDAALANDCCGKPLFEMGFDDDASRVAWRIERRLQNLGVKELIAVCPNCRAYLKKRLSVPVLSVFEKLAEWGALRPEAASGHLFLPCPERHNPEQLSQIHKILPHYKLKLIESVQCCGLGGGAAAFNGDTAAELAANAKRQTSGTLYTYCASCAGQFLRHGATPVRHLLAEALGIDEAPDTARSLRNRLRRTPEQ